MFIGYSNLSQTPSAVKICLIISALDKRACPALSRERFPSLASFSFLGSLSVSPSVSWSTKVAVVTSDRDRGGQTLAHLLKEGHFSGNRGGAMRPNKCSRPT